LGDEPSVLRDLAAIAGEYHAVAAAGGEFRVAVPGGLWRGAVSLVGDERVLVVRTFVGGD
jgi:hypothetical protein